jgi:hypothetical protein
MPKNDEPNCVFFVYFLKSAYSMTKKTIRIDINLQVGSVYLFWFIPYAYFAYSSYQFQEPENTAICYMSMGTSAFCYQFYLGFRAATSIASILLYIPTFIQIKQVSTPFPL